MEKKTTNSEIKKIQRIEKEIHARMLKYYHGDEEKTSKWYSEQQEFLFGDSPKACVWSGDGEILLNWLKERGL